MQDEQRIGSSHEQAAHVLLSQQQPSLAIKLLLLQDRQ